MTGAPHSVRFGASLPGLALSWLALGAAACGGGAAEPESTGGGTGGATPGEEALEIAAETNRSAGPKGRWNQSQGDLDPALLEQIRELESIGYAAGSTEAPAAVGVVRSDAQRLAPGLNFVVSGHAPEALLVDAAGEVLHTWSRDIRSVWSDWRVARPNIYQDFWRRAFPLEDGGILAIYESLGLVRLDARSELVWSYDGLAHHDLDVDPEGRIYVLTRRVSRVPDVDPDRPILEDFVTVLDAGGEELESVSLIECMRNSEFSDLLPGLQGDVFHTNTLEWLDGRHAQRSPVFARGNVLVSMRELDLIAIVDLEERAIVWGRRGRWRKQHQPVLLENGHVLVFDNLSRPDRSTLIEIDPLSGEERWSYGDAEGEAFFSQTCGTGQRLPNGNTLITESDNGRALEVTAGGELVWEYRSPFRAGARGELVATLFEVVRLAPEFPLDWLEGAAER